MPVYSSEAPGADVELSSVRPTTNTMSRASEVSEARDESNKIKYTVKELREVEEGIVKIGEDDEYRVAITGNEDEGFTITNTYMPPWLPRYPGLIDVAVGKYWQNVDGIDFIENEVKVELIKNGKPTGQILALNKTNALDGAKGIWFGYFRSLPTRDELDEDNVYSVREVGENNKEIIIDNNRYFVKYSGEHHGNEIFASIDNEYIGKKIDVKVAKKWYGKEKGKSATVKLIKKDKNTNI